MATTQYMACASGTYGFEFDTATSGTVTADATIVRGTNPRSWKLNTSSPAVNAVHRKAGILANAGRRISRWFNFPSVSPSATFGFMQVQTSGLANILGVSLQTSGVLRCQPTGASAVNGTTTLSTNTWYRIGLSYTITSSTSYEIRVYLNGKLEISVSSNGTLTNTASDTLAIQCLATAGTNFVIYDDEGYVDNGTDLADPGNMAITYKGPASVNVGNWNTTTGTGAVNERPISTTNGMKDSSVTTKNQNYTLQTVSVGDRDISSLTQVAYLGWVWAKQETAILGTTKITVNGTDTTITPTTSYALYTQITDSASYPSNAAGIGMVSPGLAADPVDLGECGCLIAYQEAISASHAEAATASEVDSAAATFEASEAESVTASDTPTAAVTYDGSQTETATAAEVADAVVTFAASQTESATASEAVDSISEYLLDSAESATGSEAVSAVADFAASQDESASASEAASCIVTFSASQDESATASEAQDSISEYLIATSESATAAETPSSDLTLVASRTDSGTASDVVTVMAEFSSSQTDSVAASDTSASALNIVAVVTESASAIDFSATGSLVIESVVAIDTAVATVTVSGTVTESNSATDAIESDFVSPYQALHNYRPTRTG